MTRDKLSETTLEEDFIVALNESFRYLLANPKLRKTYMRIVRGKTKKLTKTNSSHIQDLAALGIIYLYMDKTVSLTKIGKRIIKEWKKFRI